MLPIDDLRANVVRDLLQVIARINRASEVSL
jgi:hypothetical protein